MTSSKWMIGRVLAAQVRAILPFILFATIAHLSVLPLWADGCFVFKWDKKTDINEPTQKAVILHDGGREDMLLQVKYEGPLREFGWLVPVPSVPKVERGSMDAFYELSELTQRHFGTATRGVATMGLANAEDGGQPVKVIETKTVGAYEVTILSARDSGSLERWLQAHDYSIPEGKTEIVADYIRRGWYFVAAKIQLNGKAGFKMVSTSPKSTAQTRKAIQKKLSSGELHPLLISFDTPHCIFPLKISAVASKPSEVSLYVLSKQPLLNPALFEEACKTLTQLYADWEQDRSKHAGARERAMENLRVLSISAQLYASDNPDGVPRGRNQQRNWTVEDLQAMAREGVAPAPKPSLDESFYMPGDALLPCLYVETNQLTKSAKSIPRLKNSSWYLTKITKTFAAAEMRDLEFEPAVPRLIATLSRPIGRSAALDLAQSGAMGSSALISACRSGDSTTRANAVFGLENVRNAQVVEPLLALFKDKSPEVRLHAVRVAANNWSERFTDPMVALFQDAHQEIRMEATGCLSAHESRKRFPAYLALANGPDPNVRWCALGVLQQLDRDSIPKEPIIRMLKDPSPEQQNYGLHLLWKLNRDIVPREVLLPLLNNEWTENIVVALKLIEGNGRVHPAMPAPLANTTDDKQRDRWLTSAEASVLTTNRFSQARLMGLNILQRNADAKAVALAMPLLRDSSRVVRSRAFTAMKTLTGQNLSDSDPAKWEQWWAVNKNSNLRLDHP